MSEIIAADVEYNSHLFFPLSDSLLECSAMKKTLNTSKPKRAPYTCANVLKTQKKASDSLKKQFQQLHKEKKATNMVNSSIAILAHILKCNKSLANK